MVTTGAEDRCVLCHPGLILGRMSMPTSGPPAQEQTVWAVLAHLSIFVLAVIGPLAVYLVFKDTSPFTRQHAAEALNFQITVTIAAIVSGILVVLLVGLLLLPAVILFAVVMSIVAAVAAGNRQPYRYPLTFRFVS